MSGGDGDDYRWLWLYSLDFGDDYGDDFGGDDDEIQQLDI